VTGQRIAKFFLIAASVTASLFFAAAEAQSAMSVPVKKSVPATAAPAKPDWSELTPAQKEALAPLASEWSTLDADRKAKWLRVAKRYRQLSPEGQARVQQRMAEFVKLTPEQRHNLRENFRKAYELPLDERRALIQKYKDLPPERKKELADKAKAHAGGQKTAKEPPRARGEPRPADPKPQSSPPAP
jgi:hypothetical protein